jgi:putative transposase
MARQPRLYAAGYTQLISIEFSEPAQRSFQTSPEPPYRDLLTWLGQAALSCQVAIHGWSICPRVLNILATPEHEASLPSLVQALGRNFAARLQTGGVFSGRYHSTIPQPNLWVLPCLIWLEQQPIRERLVEDAETWPWSSARMHTGEPSAPLAWLAPHPDYWLCGNTPFDRQANYRRILAAGLPMASERQIASSLRGQWALGDQAFIAELQKTATRRVSPGVRGRPKMRSVPI